MHHVHREACAILLFWPPFDDDGNDDGGTDVRSRVLTSKLTDVPPLPPRPPSTTLPPLESIGVSGSNSGVEVSRRSGETTFFRPLCGKTRGVVRLLNKLYIDVPARESKPEH